MYKMWQTKSLLHIVFLLYYITCVLLHLSSWIFINQYPCCQSKQHLFIIINSHSLFDSIICNDSSHSYINTHFAVVTLQTSLKETQMSLETLNAPVNVVFKTPHEVLFHWKVIRWGTRLPVLRECEWRVQTQHVWMEISFESAE